MEVALDLLVIGDNLCCEDKIMVKPGDYVKSNMGKVKHPAKVLIVANNGDVLVEYIKGWRFERTFVAEYINSGCCCLPEIYDYMGKKVWWLYNKEYTVLAPTVKIVFPDGKEIAGEVYPEIGVSYKDVYEVAEVSMDKTVVYLDKKQ